MEDNQDKYFCYLLIKDPWTVILGYVYLGILVLFLFHVVNQFRKLNNFDAPNMITGIYYLLFMWGIFTIILIFYS